MADEHQIKKIVERLLSLYALPLERDSSNRDTALRKSFHLLAESLALDFQQDNVGNIYLTTPGRDPDFPPLGICFPLHSSASATIFEGALRAFLALQSRRLSCAVSLIGWTCVGNDWLDPTNIIMATAALAQGSIPRESSNLYFEQEGNKDGPAILCIHGLGGTTNFYQPIVSALEDYNVVRFDLSGHGRSSLPSKHTSIASYVEDSESVIDHLGLKDITVAGHSMGGLVALSLAAKRPEIVKRLILFGPVKTPLEAGQNGLRARAKAVRDHGMATVADAVIGASLSPNTLENKPEVVGFSRELLSRQSPEGYAQACEALADGPDPQWDKITAEVTILGGADDKVSAGPLLDALTSNLIKAKKVTRETWENVGHWHTLENPKGSTHAF
ncbi:fumarylacetoacetate hydrolase [Paecilomyces variotii No. 5]|uniref:Fumarylacetoacetate hydrolase n=1 Tax=Byssochlamys spectabilis (strain No. 5 / NBRC 109023) TaxID=1356009 RepID=V5FQ19_BYSSN|nr:fumarylacetoacetate hydrolase [Paecilomyces variotii No. 5]